MASAAARSRGAGSPRRLVAVAAAALALAACGEPGVELALPERPAGSQVADEAGVLSGAVADRLEALRAETGHDVVALTFESSKASLGEAKRGGELVVEEWGADVALVAVGFPGHFTEPDPDARRRYFGVEADRLTVSRGLREDIVEGAVPPHAAGNDWTDAFIAAIDVLAEALPPAAEAAGPPEAAGAS